MPDKDEFDYRAALERLDHAANVRVSDFGPEAMANQSAVSADVQARAFVSIANSLHRIASHMCDKGGGGTPAG